MNPIWNENFEFLVEDETTQNLTVKIYDDEGVQASEPLGSAQVPLKSLQPGKVKEVWLTLVKDVLIQKDTKYRGQVSKQLCSSSSSVYNISKHLLGAQKMQ